MEVPLKVLLLQTVVKKSQLRGTQLLKVQSRLVLLVMDKQMLLRLQEVMIKTWNIPLKSTLPIIKMRPHKLKWLQSPKQTHYHPNLFNQTLNHKSIKLIKLIHKNPTKLKLKNQVKSNLNQTKLFLKNKIKLPRSIHMKILAQFQILMKNLKSKDKSIFKLFKIIKNLILKLWKMKFQNLNDSVTPHKS